MLNYERQLFRFRLALAGDRPSRMWTPLNQSDKKTIAPPKTQPQLFDVVVPGESGQILAYFNIHSPSETRSAKFPLQTSCNFDVKSPSFRRLFEEREPYYNESRLFAYAIHLHGLARSKNIPALREEFKLKMHDYARVYETDPVLEMQVIAFFLSKTLFPAKLDLGFERGDLLAVPHCEGRIWQFIRKPQSPFFMTFPNLDGRRYLLPIYVARVGGELRIIR